LAAFSGFVPTNALVVTELSKFIDWPETGLWEAPEIVFQGADKSQLAMAESVALDRIAFAFYPPRNRTEHLPSGEKPGSVPFSSEQSDL
jgi:hypothetical protein